MKTSLLIITALSGFILLSFCGEHEDKKHKKKDKEEKEAGNFITFFAKTERTNKEQ